MNWITGFLNRKQKKQVMNKTYDEIVKEAKTVDATEKKAKEVSRTVKMKAKSKLESSLSNAEIEKLDAEDQFEKAVIEGGDIAKAALELKAAEATFNFYNDLVNTLFPKEAAYTAG